MRNDLTQAELMEELEYNPETGAFLRLKKKARFNIGDVAGSKPDVNGYIAIKLNGVLYRAHRLAWLYVHGEWPEGFLDHKNGDPSDNRIENLRLASRGENMHNRKINTNNQSGTKGVSKCSDCDTWIVQIRHNKVNYYKRFKELEDAVWYANVLREELHGEYARAE